MIEEFLIAIAILFPNFVTLMFIALMFAYFIVSIVEKISKKENKNNEILKEVTIIDFIFVGITKYISYKIDLLSTEYMIIMLGCVIGYVIAYLAYYILNKEKNKK